MLDLDVAKAAPADHRAGFVEQRPRTDIHPDVGPVGGTTPALEVKAVPVVRIQLQRFRQVLAHQVVEHRFADDPFARPSEHFFHGRGDPFHAAVSGGAEHHVGGVLSHQPVVFLAAGKRLTGKNRVTDVGDLRDEVPQVTLLIAHPGNREIGPDDLPEGFRYRLVSR